jgi:transcription-repair coupling factor (superfamily II helicase)
MTSVIEPFSLTLLARVAKALEFDPPPIRLVGLHSCTPLGLFLSQHSTARLRKNPHLVITGDVPSAERLQESLLFFDPAIHVHVLPPFDVGVYSSLYPNQRVLARRLRWLHHAANARPGEIFIAPLEGLLQKTLPYNVFIKNVFEILRGSEIPSEIQNRLLSLGYVSVPTVEDVGTFSFRGGILDIYSPANELPCRIELFGDQVESLRLFDPKTQMSLEDTTRFTVLPAREVLYSDDNRQKVAQRLKHAAADRAVSKEELHETLRAIAQGQPFYGMDFLLPYFYDLLDSPLQYFNGPLDIWHYDRSDLLRMSDQLHRDLKNEYQNSSQQVIHVNYSDLYSSYDTLEYPSDSTAVWMEKIEMLESHDPQDTRVEIKSFSLADFADGAHALARDNEQLAQYVGDRLSRWRAQNHQVYIAAHSQNAAERLRLLLERASLHPTIFESSRYDWSHIQDVSRVSPQNFPIILRELSDGFRIPEEGIVFLRDEDIWGRRRIHKSHSQDLSGLERAAALSFGELKAGDLVAHSIHGVGAYEGLRAMNIDGAQSEFIELRYRDGDRLYLPVYRVAQLHKYSGPGSEHMLDKLGGTGWLKAKTKVRSQLRDVASQLIKLYAKRSLAKRNPLPPLDADYTLFENSFPYEETEDQLRAINDVLNDFTKDHPMDRLICGDVGFGKTEVALRATFRAVQEKMQVAIIAPTTILTFQHYENFKKRFKSWPIEVRALNRFVSAKDVKKTLLDLKEGRVDVIIGTHRLLSKDVAFKNLGLLIIDEEQKFGVVHKEKLRLLREGVDTMAMSATPIPRTLNLSLVGVRDLSLINTAPENRLPTRTFISKFDPETIRKAIETEISRGGQVFFLHNRVQSIDETAAQLRSIVPFARMAVAHGQMDEHQLEETMLKFFNHEVDVLICTAIIESGMDIPRANTIFIDNAHTFGVSQLYQLRGRVGRSQERAYCYLLLPPNKKLDATAQERLKILQENTALGSGLRVAQYDLELRGAGDILGEDQSGHIQAVGYELYMELLEEAIHELKGAPSENKDVEPEINLRISALIPDKYIPDIRMRLYYYKALSSIKSIEDIDRIESELRDQFGPLPDPVLNLLGLMLVRKLCRDLGIKDISSGKSAISLAFTEHTSLPPNEVVRLTSKENKKYQLAPDQRLKVRMNDISWPNVVTELENLLRLCPQH